jgi:hypothetical protein
MEKGGLYFRNKNAQVTIFVVIALVIVGAGILVYFLFPDTISDFVSTGSDLENPQLKLQQCVEENIVETIQTLSLQGGDLDPTNYILYDDSKVRYLCYTGEYYQPCVMQESMLINYVENQIEGTVLEQADNCFKDLIDEYEKKGYVVSVGSGDITLELVPENVVINFDRSVTLTKEETRTYEGFDIVVNNNIYELLEITNKILDDEAKYGDSETTTVMEQYHHIKVEKDLKTDGSTIYTLTNRDTEDKFMFASRSLVMPPGYGLI